MLNWWIVPKELIGIPRWRVLVVGLRMNKHKALIYTGSFVTLLLADLHFLYCVCHITVGQARDS